MPRAQRKGPVRAFLDSSVLIAAVLSPTGGSFRILKESRARKLRAVVNHYVVDEVREVLARKYPAFIPRFHYLLKASRIMLMGDPSVRAVARCLPFINREDAPVLAGALKAHADFLVTLDRDFTRTDVLKTALPFRVVTPGALIDEVLR